MFDSTLSYLDIFLTCEAWEITIYNQINRNLIRFGYIILLIN